MKFKIGDRVATYWAPNRNTVDRKVGTITEILKNDILIVQLDDGNGLVSYHEAQCRKLKKKEKKVRSRLWIFIGRHQEEAGSFFAHVSKIPRENYIEFIEVKRK